MPTICCAVGCKHSSGNGVCRLKRFPSDAKRSVVWEKNLRRNHWIRKDWELLCECHFHFSQFEKVREDGAKKLRHNAVPTLFPTHTIPLPQVSGSHVYSAAAYSYPKVKIISPSNDDLETLVPLAVHFEESAFESHRADGLKKLKPNAVPTIRGVSGPVNRKRRKRKDKQTIEFTFGENDKESFVLAEKVPVEPKERDTIQISELYCSELDEMHKKPERRKRLKTLHVTEIVSNGLSLPMQSSGDKTDPIKLCSPFSSAENQADRINVKKPKQDCPTKLKNKGRAMKYNVNISAEFGGHQSVEISPELVDQDISGSGTSVPTEEDLQVECYVCSKAINPGHGISLSIPTEATHVLMVKRLEVIANVDGLLNLEEVVCSRCASLLNHVDRTEAELDVLKSAISTCTRGRNIHHKFRRTPEYAFNVQLLDRFGSLKEGSHNILSLDELFLIQEESKEMTEMPIEESSKEEQSQVGEVEEFNRNSLADETPPDMDADNCPSSLIPEPEERPLSSSSQLNLEPGLKELDSTSIIVTSDVPASHTIPSASHSENSSNQTTSYHINHSSNTHACKICSFKTPYDSVMVWHLRMHMKTSRWCDFCNVTIPMEESHFLSMKKKVSSSRTRRRPITKSTPPAILPAAQKESSSYPFKPICVPLISIENEKTSAPVLVITKEHESLQEAVKIATAIIELPKNFESEESIIEHQGLVGSGTVQDKPEVGEEKVQGKIDAQLNEPLCVEEFSSVAESGSERLETVNTVGTIREEFSISINECDNLLVSSAGQDFSTLPNQHGDINDACVSENVGEFNEDGIQVSKSDNLNDREVFCEDSVEHSFLDTLSSQQDRKFHEILPEICSESNEQGMISIASDASEGNLTNKDVSFARSDGLGESELAIAYENSVAALMCQSDDSEGILSYQ